MNKNVLLGLLATCVFLLISVLGNAQDKVPAKTSPPSEFLNTLTALERAWLRDHPVISVAQDPGWPPIEFTDERGTPSGMTADYLRLIEERLGVKFQQVNHLNWQEAYAQMKRWEIDMTTSVAATPERETFWAFTKPYMTIPLVIVTRSDVTYIADLRELEGKQVVVVAGYVAESWIARDFPKIQLIRVQTAQEALDRLQSGEVFACVENMLVLDRYISKLKMSGLKITGNTPYNNAQCMAVRKDWAIFAGILDQALDSISATERHAIYRKWLPVSYQSPFDYTRLWPVAAILGVVLMGLGAWNWKLAAEIRQRKQAEAEISELNRTLEQRVQERTAELLAANQELNAFAYAASHDLRQPLRAMNGFSQALVEDFGATLPSAAHEFLNQIILASRRMGALIDGLLQLSRTTRGELQRDAVDLSALAARLLGELAMAEPERRMTWTVAPGLTAWGDERMIEVIMANLLGNAWKYTAKTPQPQIAVAGQLTDGEPSFSVSDNGAGFDMQHAAKLFQPFQRLHREDEFPGIGIGLATVQRIVHRHGGTIRATATPGQGAAFTFMLSTSGPENKKQP